MKTSNFFIPTLREAPSEAEISSHRLMLRAGLVRQLAAGIYTWLPLGLRVLRKVEAVIREEMDLAGAQEVLMSSVQPAELWKESTRWEAYGPELLRFTDRHDRDFCLGPTHEEIITDLVRGEITSYKQLPCNLYQIQMKFRDEIRPRFGIMRAREFLMKDAYSFHIDADSLEETYQKMHATYCKIFDRLGLEYRAVIADTGNIGGSKSHEFHVLADSGEDELVYSEETDFAANSEVAKNHPDRDKLKTCRGIEVGHIFQLGTKYSEAMKAEFIDESGKPKSLLMGCYGIGVSRIVAAAIEQGHDEKGIIFPSSIAPFEIIITPIAYDKSEDVKKAAESVYSELLALGFDVLLDDRGLRPGVMFSEAELLGIPHRITMSDKTIKEKKVEYKKRGAGESDLIDLTLLKEYLK